MTGRDDALQQRAPGARHLEAVDGPDRACRFMARVRARTRLTKISSSELCVVCRSLNRCPARQLAAAGRDAGRARPGRRRCRSSSTPSAESSSRRPASAAGIAASRLLQAAGQLLACRASASASAFSSTRIELALVDDADAVGHLLGFLDVVGGQDDGHAARRAAARTSPHMSRRSSTSTPAVGSSRNRIARLVGQRLGDHHPTLHAAGEGHDPVCPSCPTATGLAAPSRYAPGSARLPNRPRLKLTVAQTRLERVGRQLLRDQTDLRARRAVVA